MSPFVVLKDETSVQHFHGENDTHHAIIHSKNAALLYLVFF